MCCIDREPSSFGLEVADQVLLERSLQNHVAAVWNIGSNVSMLGDVDVGEKRSRIGGT